MIPFEIRTLKIGHTEQRRTQRFYIVAIVRHRGTVGAWRNRGYLRVLLIFLSTSFQSSGLQDFLKRLFVYYQSYQQHVHYATVALCAFGTSVRLSLYFHLRVLPLSVWLLYVVGLIYHSIFRKNLNKTAIHSVSLCDISSNVLNLGSSLIVLKDWSKQTLPLLLPHKPLFSVDLTCISSQYIKKRIEVICHTK